ncbi:MAG: beta-propeller domain-containing protein [Deltaproteobacteria bacterium]|nr:beta-propeller domain-containing protein [Deltaproteobacteria bacterium]
MAHSRWTRVLGALIAVVALIGSACTPREPTDRPARPVGRDLPRFESDEAFTRFASDLESRFALTRGGPGGFGTTTAMPMPASPTASAGAAGEAAAEAGDSAGGADSDDSITNTQVAGVDEGGIVKTHGDHLIVLRRGRLFSIDVSNGQRRAVSRADVAPNGAGGGAWYDEMLVWRDTIIVIGYSYASQGTELVFFDIDARGTIRPRGRQHLRSNDYYSTRNYASRLLGNTLVFYMPYSVFEPRYADGRLQLRRSFPAVRDASGPVPSDWREIVRVTDVARPVQDAPSPILHTVITCDLAAPSLQCRGRGILGPAGRTFFVSENAVYVWAHEGHRVMPGIAAPAPEDPRSPREVVYRLPLGEGPMGAIRVSGAPTDQLSFREADDELTVLVRGATGGDGMGGGEHGAGAVSLARMPLGWFTEGLYTAPQSAYTRLPDVQGYSMQNRFVGHHVLYGAGGGWNGPAQGAERRLHMHDLRSRQSTSLELAHGVDRIEAMGEDGVAIGSDGRNLVFSAIDLDDRPRVAGRYVQEGATQGETRTHGFFYRAEGREHGTIGLPVRSGDSSGWEQLRSGSAQILFLRVESATFTRAGALGSRPGAGSNDACSASCVDWYGNARPIFYRGRVFALLGYELVEGQSAGASITEIGRTMFLHPES